jgi:histone demethylase JARID1
MGFNYGWNCTEAVNFATLDWLGHGAAASASYRAYNLRVNGTDQPKRRSLLGFERLLFTLAANWSCYSPEDRRMVYKFLEPIVQEELCGRQGLVDAGVKKVAEAANCERSSPTRISKETRDFDEMRECCLCKHPCFLSVVICECSSDRVACLQHWTQMCGCSAEKKTAVAYETQESMQQALLCLASPSDSGSGELID